MAGWGGPRPNSGRKPGSKGKAAERRVIAATVLSQIDEVAFWLELLTAERVLVIGSEGKYEKLTVPDYTTRADAAKFLTVQRDGRAYQQLNPAQRLPGGDGDPKLAAVLQNLLHQPGTEVTLTEKKARITSGTQALENINAEGKAKLPPAPSLAPDDMSVTLDASATSQIDPSGHKAGVGHFGAESHTERNQDSELVQRAEEEG